MTERSGVTLGAVTERSGVTLGAVTERSGVTLGAVTERSGVTLGAVTDEATAEQRRAALRVLRGAPSDAELAALTVVLAAAAAAAPTVPSPAARDRWSDPAARLRVPLHPGPGAWRAFTLPR